MVAPSSAPHSSRAAMIAEAQAPAPVRGRRPRCCGSRPSRRRTPPGPARDSRDRPRWRCARRASTRTAEWSTARRVASYGRHRRELEQRVGVVALGHPPEPARNERSSESPQHRGDRRLAERRVVRLDRRDVGRPERAPGERQHRVRPPCRRGRRRAQQPARRPVERRDHQVGEQGEARAAGPRRGETRSRGDGRGGTGLPETMSASRIVTGSPVFGRHDADAVAPGRADAQQVGHRRPARGPGLAGQHAAYDDPLSDDVRAQTLG